MDSTIMLQVAIFLVGLVALIGFFKTKSEGFGKFTTSTLVLLMVLILCSLLYASNQLDGQLFANVLMAIIGFAGGLVVAKD